MPDSMTPEMFSAALSARIYERHVTLEKVMLKLRSEGAIPLGWKIVKDEGGKRRAVRRGAK